MKLKMPSCVVMVLFLVACGTLCGCQEKKIIDVGMSRSEVELILGKPNQVEIVYGKQVAVYQAPQSKDWMRRITYDKKDIVEDVATNIS
jgi:outer membrane protein assembly factor BamE (lipoprotein component of BamABCDE complex)